MRRGNKRMGDGGALFVFALPMIVIIFAWAGLALTVGRAYEIGERTQSVSDAALLSSLRIRAAALEKIAERWQGFGHHFIAGRPEGLAEAPRSAWPEIQSKSAELKNALSGYKGRISSVVTVVLNANGRTRQTLETLDNRASLLGTSARPVNLKDEAGSMIQLAGGWYSRDWTAEASSLQTLEWRAVPLKIIFSPSEELVGTVFSSGQLVWDVNPDSAEVKAGGNGGYPLTWIDALEGTAIHPFRWPRYRAALVASRKRDTE